MKKTIQPILTAVLFLLLSLIVYVRYEWTGSNLQIENIAGNGQPESPGLLLTDPPGGDEEKEYSFPVSEPSSEPVSIPMPSSQQSNLSSSFEHYTETTYLLVSDIVFTYKSRPDEPDLVQDLLRSLESENESLGIAWHKIIDYWDFARNQMPIDTVPPEDLSQKSDLCIVVLGYQLFSDGTMTTELTGRCEKALSCALKYPNAYIALCGGGTASLNQKATEAKVMAGWFVEHGIQDERLILEERSQTTVDNVKMLSAILKNEYPQIDKLLIVSSDYHIPVSCLLFSAEAYLSEWNTGVSPYRVVGNTAFKTSGDSLYTSIATQAQYLWSLADPTY